LAHNEGSHRFSKFPEMFLFSTHDWVKEYGTFKGQSWLSLVQQLNHENEEVYCSAI